MIVQLWNLLEWTSRLVMRCSHSSFIIIDAAFKNEIVSTLSKTLVITVKFCSVQSHQSNPTLRSFSEGDIVYCHFPLKTIISDLKLLSKNCKYLLLDHCTLSLKMTSSCASYLQWIGWSLSRHFTYLVSNKVL